MFWSQQYFLDTSESLPAEIANDSSVQFIGGDQRQCRIFGTIFRPGVELKVWTSQAVPGFLHDGATESANRCRVDSGHRNFRELFVGSPLFGKVVGQ